jgi:hypothetical protein
MGFDVKGECGEPSHKSDPSVRGLPCQVGAVWMQDVVFTMWIDAERGPDEGGLSSLTTPERAVGSSGGRLTWDGCTLTRPPALRAASGGTLGMLGFQEHKSVPRTPACDPRVRAVTGAPLSVERGSPGIGTR